MHIRSLYLCEWTTYFCSVFTLPVCWWDKKPLALLPPWDTFQFCALLYSVIQPRLTSVPVGLGSYCEQGSRTSQAFFMHICNKTTFRDGWGNDCQLNARCLEMENSLWTQLLHDCRSQQFFTIFRCTLHGSAVIAPIEAVELSNSQIYISLVIINSSPGNIRKGLETSSADPVSSYQAGRSKDPPCAVHANVVSETLEPSSCVCSSVTRFAFAFWCSSVPAT